MAEDEDEISFDLVSAMEADGSISGQQLTLYIPDKNRAGDELGNQRAWVLEAAQLLARIGGGVTIMPPVEGGWLDTANNVLIWERPVLVYTFIKYDRFMEFHTELRDFLHRLGRETNQGEVLADFWGTVVRITKFREKT